MNKTHDVKDSQGTSAKLKQSCQMSHLKAKKNNVNDFAGNEINIGRRSCSFP
jgi:hypothetical protein